MGVSEAADLLEEAGYLESWSARQIGGNKVSGDTS